MDIISFDKQGSSIAKNAFWGFLLQALLKFKGVILLPIIVHFLSRDVLGEWRLITTTVSVLLPVLSLNLFDGSGMFFSSDVDKESVRTKYYSIFNMALCLELVSFLLCIAVSFFYKGIEPHILFLIYLYFAAMFNYKLGIMLLQTYQKSRFLMLVNLFAEYGGVAFSLVLLAFGVRNVTVLLIPPVVLYTLSAIFMFIRIGREIPYQRGVDRSFIRQVLPISLSLMPVFLAEWLLMSVGVYALDFFFGQGEVGYYSVLVSLASLALALRATLQFFWFSTCSNMIRSGDPQFGGFFSFVLKVYLLLIAIALILYAGFSRELILIMADSSYLLIEKSLFLVVAGNCLMVLSCIWNGIMYARGEGGKITLSYLVAGAVSVLLTPLLVRYFRVMGASIAYFLANAVLLAMMVYKAGKVHLDWTSKDLRFCIGLAATIIVTAALVFLKVDHRAVAGICVAGLITLLILNERFRFIPIRSLTTLLGRKPQ